MLGGLLAGVSLPRSKLPSGRVARELSISVEVAAAKEQARLAALMKQQRKPKKRKSKK